MEEFHDDYPQYEMAHHSEEEGVLIRKKLWRVFWIMLGITIAELFVGIMAYQWGLQDIMGRATISLKLFFIAFTIIKAFYIVYAFMHLGDEKKALKWVIIGPYTVFILYLIYMCSVTEGTFTDKYREEVDAPLMQHAKDRKAGLYHHELGASTEGHGEGHDEKGKEEHPAKPKH